MKAKWMLLPVLAATLAASWSQASGQTMGTAFTYQGRLVKSGTPVTDTCNFMFGLWDEVTLGGQVGTSPASVPGVAVSGGLFTANIDFGTNAFDGDARWLEIKVECPSGSGFTTLTPRQALKPTPYALALPGLWTQADVASPNLIGGFIENEMAPGVQGGTISGGGFPGDIFDPLPAANRVTDNYGTVAGGGDNQAGDGIGLPDSAQYATVSGGRQNDARAVYATVPGGSENEAAAAWSYAAGRRAKILDLSHQGTFVWADNQAADFTSSGSKQFLVRAYAGMGLSNLTSLTAADMTHMFVIKADTNTMRLIGPLGSYGHGAKLNFGDGNYAYLQEDLDDQLTIKSNRTAILGGYVGINTTDPTARLDVDGTTQTKTLIILGGSDLAEPFTIANNEDGEDCAIEPGSIVVIDPANPGKVRLATQAYDRKVAGIISGANGLSPGMVMTSKGAPYVDGDHPVALSGRVWCLCDASFGPIEPGDLLTTSDTPGHSMKVIDHFQAQGAIIGKAMTGLSEGATGLVLVLVSLQ